MGSLGRRRILRARGSTSALIEAAAAAGGEGEDRFASAFGRLDAARRRHKRAARLDAGRAAWMQQHAALAQAARRFDDDEKATVPRDDLSQIDELRTMVACLAQADDDQAEARRRAAAIVARMMVDARQAHASKGASLAEEEAAARLAVEDAVATMNSTLREDDGGDDELVEVLRVGDDEAFLAPVAEELRETWAARRDDDREKRRRIDDKLRDALATIGDGSDALDSRGPWDDSAHALLETQHSKKIDALKVVLPQFSEDALRKHVARGDAVNAHAREKCVWRREQKAWRADFVGKCGERLEAARRDHVDKVAKDALYDEMGRRQRALHACVDKLRAEREVRDQKLAVARELRDALQAEQAAERQALQKEEQRRAKDLILQYRAEQFRAEAERKLVEAAARKERERVQREQAKHGAERAKYREGVREAQRSEKEKALERLARADEARAIALEALARTVPYFEAISNIENDVTKTTAAVEAQRADQRTAADKTGYTTGLTDERVFRDPAFKIGLAMRSLGVARTGAARDAVARLVGPRAVNPITGARG